MDQNGNDTHYMQRALDVARQALGHTSPNPTVGAVIVKDGQIIGEGATQPPGQAHAEVMALRSAGPAARGGTMYATLEPCNHFGRTPPCTDAIIQAGITKLVYALPDPNPVAAGGHKKLKEAGIEIVSGVCQAEATEMNRFFFHHTATGRPYVVAKFGMSLDGKIATASGHSQWITGPAARQKGHWLRHICDAILVGAGTAKADNPRLTTRLPEESDLKASHPLRLILDSAGRLPTDLTLFQAALPGETWVVTTESISSENRSRFDEAGIELLPVASDENGRVDICNMLDRLGRCGIQSLMVEGGGTVLGSFFDRRAVDEVWAFVAPKIIGGRAALGPIGGQGIDHLSAAFTLTDQSIEQVGNDWLIRGKILKDRE